ITNNIKLKMRNKLIDELEKMIELLHQTGWHKQAVWYENKLKLIKEGEEDCESFYQNLHEIDASLSGIGSFSDLPMKQKFVSLQWNLSERIHQLILENIGNNHLNC
ncbi:hypothetical protein, partial [Bacteroides thetaiotaomicron]